MTAQEARQQVDEYECQITSAYSELRDSATIIGFSAAQAQSSSTTTKIMLTLIISLFGLFFLSVVDLIGGILLIIVGIYFAHTAYDSAVYVQKEVNTQVGYLNSMLDNNTII